MIRLFLLLLIVSTSTFAQPVEYLKEFSIRYDTTDTHPLKPTKQLIKVGLVLPIFRQSSVAVSSIWKTLGVDVTLEQKLNQRLALNGGLEMSYSFSGYAQLYSIDLPIGFRYYFPIGKRMKNRFDPHSFFSPYVSFQTHNSLYSSLLYNPPYKSSAHNYYRGNLLDHPTNSGKYDESFNMVQYAYFQIGSQLKITKANYLDVNIIVPIPALTYHKTDFTLSSPSLINIRYGIFKW
ncbi:hypothetical protein [Spirosoma gilvum]